MFVTPYQIFQTDGSDFFLSVWCLAVSHVVEASFQHPIKALVLLVDPKSRYKYFHYV